MWMDFQFTTTPAAAQNEQSIFGGVKELKLGKLCGVTWLGLIGQIGSKLDSSQPYRPMRLT
jgi:hypothetical protein